MFFLEPPRTAYDLNWRLFGIPVRVNPWFWVVTVLMGGSTLQAGLQYLAVWVLCVFVSILIHELGHVFMGQAFGAYGHVVLYGFGGLAVGSSDLRNRWQRIAVSVAGPLADFVLFGLVWVAWRALPQLHTSALAAQAFADLYWVNLIWGAVNLLPIFPLDGGLVSKDFLEGVVPRQGFAYSLGLSAAVAGLGAVLFLLPVVLHRPWFLGTFFGQPIVIGKDWFMVLFFGILAFNSFFAIQQIKRVQGPPSRERHEPWESDRAPWEQDPDFWKR